MDNFTSSSSSLPPPPTPMPDILPASASSSSAAFDDGSEDFCSICLEPFSTDDPATITNCKHEYHLHCILEWSQRSKECPICWQILVLKDPANQELLAAVEAEKRIRSRGSYSSAFPHPRTPIERFNVEQDDSCSDDSDFDEQIMQHLVAAASRAHYFRRRDVQRSSGVGPSRIPVVESSLHVSGLQPVHTTSPSGDSSPSSTSAAGIQPPPPAPSSVEAIPGNSTPDTHDPFKARVLYSQPPSESVRRLNTSEMFTFPESIKTKFSAASARYKESISKGTRGLKEKLLAHNASVKELSKGVQREMNAGIAGVARMIERLDLGSKQATASPSMPSSTEGTSGFPSKGKTVQENGSGQSLHSAVEEESGVVIHDVRSGPPAQVSSATVSPVGYPHPHVQSGCDAVKT
ncbi:E3 ubiquitin-protein ligase RHF1A-like [Neltuma alba]|uniref:E3 ubiquitin-protein ligase RHF1A-like n=1 Tax=Neltuma alba TaxID=207710 RepID=UPI0010A45DB6|nr:E3 ubiquitin-protein ligase RHF1A-like [Prosopis alba]XP_028774398.1 E3 ubiquitin-protein ligase RHF1A-like [Prosopis alba]